MLLDNFFGLILNENTLLLNFLSRFFHLVAFVWEFLVLKVNSMFACWIFAYLIYGDLVVCLFSVFASHKYIFFWYCSAFTAFISKWLSCFCGFFDVQLSSFSCCVGMFRRAAKTFFDFFFLNWFYVCFLPLFSGVFLNVIRYSKRMEILLYLVLFCPLK